MKFMEELQKVLIDTVAPLVGAWIEITQTILTPWIDLVAPLVGAWIEIFLLFCDFNCEPSLPLWERGLKLLQHHKKC